MLFWIGVKPECKSGVLNSNSQSAKIEMKFQVKLNIY